MGSDMTPQQALETIAQVRGYRERLTARAAGQVWMVWGLALALLATTELAALVPAPEPEGEGLRVGLAWQALPLPLAALAGGVLATNAVWRAHALERGERHRSWVAWAAVGAFLVAAMATGLLALLAVVAWAVPAGPDTQVLVGPGIAAVGALLLSVLQRRRVPAAPGLAAAAALVAANLLLPLVPGASLAERVYGGVQAGSATIAAAFVAVGLWHARSR
jgi:hypothetical protein